MSQKKPNEIPKNIKQPPAPPPLQEPVTVRKFEFVDKDGQLTGKYSNQVTLRISPTEVLLDFFFKINKDQILVSQIIMAHDTLIKLHGLLDSWVKPKEKA